MESMVDNSRPTRAEITDVGQAVYDFNDCTMLSGETGNGKFPVESVKIMSDICKQTEDNMNYEEHYKLSNKLMSSKAREIADFSYKK